MKKLLLDPIVIITLLLVGVVLCQAFDVLNCVSKYLYFTTEIEMLLAMAAFYVVAFKGKSWKSPPEPEDDLPSPSARRIGIELYGGLAFLTILMVLLWFIFGKENGLSLKAWAKSGHWFLFYLGVFSGGAFLIKKYVKYVRMMPLVLSTAFLSFYAAVYEMLLLSHGTGWKYNNTVIAWVLGVPVENVLFVYPVAIALAIIFYVIVSRRMNDLKAFWVLNFILAPCSVVVELIGIYVFDLWVIFNDKSIWPMGKSNLEEFLYYIFFQAWAMLLYAFFKRYIKPAAQN